jgi:selenocysteine lyase/cysteine desulfurase
MSELLYRIRESAIGDDALLPGPYGYKRLTYADHTASGRSLTFIEEYLRAEVLPWYANTHTESSATGRHTTRLREQARTAVRDGIGGDEKTVVIFTGSGCTGAIDKLIRILGLSTRDCPHRTDRPLVLVGPYEHHSNELLWRESRADVVRIRVDARGGIDLADLDRVLSIHSGRSRIIGSFSAGSNVTGVLADVPAVTARLRAAGALACWDYAAAGPHVPIAMAEHKLAAVFLSPHKFPGGPGTPGVLAVRREHVANAVPTVPGGGTITYVHPSGQSYLDDPAHREEGGTPAIVESIRAGLVFRLQRVVGVETVARREAQLVQRAIASWRADSAIELLGDPDAPRLPIVSFVARPFRQRPLHHNFVVAVLSDLFGIQARGGCSCAGPYGHHLLRIDPVRAHAFRAGAVAGWLGVKPGWARVSFAAHMSDAVADYIIAAVHLVARCGHRLLPEYRFDPRSGQWWHRDEVATTVALPDFADGSSYKEPERAGEEVLALQLAQARDLLAARGEPDPCGRTAFPADIEKLRWFAT